MEVERARIEMEKTRLAAMINALMQEGEAKAALAAAGSSRLQFWTKQTGLTVFDNRPETYVAWKSMFHNATADLNLKCCEELDLLTKWLSGESLQHALRAVHVSNPQQVWNVCGKGSTEIMAHQKPSRLHCLVVWKDFPELAIKTVTSCKSLQTSSESSRRRKMKGIYQASAFSTLQEE
ncbi:hypothetical protein D4764_12G0008580 [Takifugu flavidus]|uniref:Uncharacterized protein n=1 Tax=Takifugu flavidus TaxID=433684 RepID=A0A5C6PFL2_9TELE|nr:hypothetical protein D4764_12G0008580 [Takifugu flavidus]